MVGARVRRQQVAYARARPVRRRACALLSVARSTLGYVSRLVARDAPVVTAMRTLAGQYPRYGYRHDPDLPRARRATRWAPTGCIACGARRGCRCRRSGRVDAWPPAAHGRCRRRRSIMSGRTTSCSTRAPTASTLKCLTVIDEFTRECLAIDVAGGIRSGRVIEVLAQLVSVHGAPRYLRSDNGPEFVARRDPALAADRADRDRASSIPASRGRTAPTNLQRQVPRRVPVACSGSAIASKRRSASSSGGGTTTRFRTLTAPSRLGAQPLQREAALSCSASFLLGPVAAASGSPSHDHFDLKLLAVIGPERADQPVLGQRRSRACSSSCSADL